MNREIRECLARAGFEIEGVRDEDRLSEVGLDSLLLVLWVSEMERAFKVRIPADRIPEFESVSDAEKIVLSLGGKEK